MTPERVAAEFAKAMDQARMVLREDSPHLEERALGALGGERPSTPQELLHVADVIAAEGGLVTIIGRSLRLQALLWGATTVEGWSDAPGRDASPARQTSSVPR